MSMPLRDSCRRPAAPVQARECASIACRRCAAGTDVRPDRWPVGPREPRRKVPRAATRAVEQVLPRAIRLVGADERRRSAP